MVKTNGLTHVDCMAHARRRFHDAVKAQGKNKKTAHAHNGLLLIRKLYKIEKQARALSAKERHGHRQQHAQEVFAELRL